MANRAIVAVFGSSQVAPGTALYEEASRAGALLAQQGFVVCSGGYGGLMEAVSCGAKEVGGSTIGVTTSAFRGLACNAWLDQEVRTSSFLERLATIVQMGAGYLALKGGVGTLTEISTLWSLFQTQSIPLRPFVLLRDPWAKLVDFCTRELILRPGDLDHLRLAETSAEAVQLLGQALRRKQP